MRQTPTLNVYHIEIIKTQQNKCENFRVSVPLHRMAPRQRPVELSRGRTIESKKNGFMVGRELCRASHLHIGETITIYTDPAV